MSPPKEYDPWGIVPPKRSKRSNFAPWEDLVSQVDPSDRRDDPSEWVLIHPTARTRLFKEILLGEFGYTEGQGVYNSVRSTETAIRQIQATILTNTLDAVRYEDLRRDWEEHAEARGMDPASVAVLYGAHSEAEAVRVAERVFETWRKTLQTALLDMIRGVAACFSSGEPDSAASFSKYIDWICCLGMVPMLRGKNKAGGRKGGGEKGCRGEGPVDSGGALSASERDALAKENMEVARSVLSRGRDVASELAECVEAVTIMEYDRALIEYNFARREVRAKDAVTGERGECIVIWRPVMRNMGVIFDSPLQRIYAEVMACHALRRHVDVCRVVNTAPVKVILGKRPEEERGTAGARKAVERALGERGGSAEAAAGSAAARLVRLIINMKGMKHIGDITETVREYLEETGSHLLDASAIDTSQAGFGRTNKIPPSVANRGGVAGGGSGLGGGPSGFPAAEGPGGQNKVRDAFQASVIGSINGMLEGYINRLFGTVENLEAANSELEARVRRKDAEIWRLRKTALRAKQAEADARAESRARFHHGAADGTLLDDDRAADHLAEMGRDIIDVSGNMGDESYVANSFQSRYIPSYESDLSRLSALWEQELIRCFKMTRLTNNQGQETSVSYSNSAITLLVAPYFFSVLRVKRLGFLVTNQEAYRSEEELCSSIFEKSRLETYLQDLGGVFVADVKRASALYASSPAFVGADKRSDPGNFSEEEENERDWARGGSEEAADNYGRGYQGGERYWAQDSAAGFLGYGTYSSDTERIEKLRYMLSGGRVPSQSRRSLSSSYTSTAAGYPHTDRRREWNDSNGSGWRERRREHFSGRPGRPSGQQRYARRAAGVRGRGRSRIA